MHDIGLGQLTMNPNRIKRVDFSSYVRTLESVWISKQPNEVISMLTLVLSFDLTTWVVLVLSAMTVSFVSPRAKEMGAHQSIGQKSPDSAFYVKWDGLVQFCTVNA